ncbi:Midasin [Trichinella pseudospiralis]
MTITFCLRVRWSFVKMSDVPEKNIDSLIKFDSTDSSLTGSNSESFQEVLDSSEVSSLNTESSKTDSTLGSTCLTGEYTKVEIPMQDAKQCYVLNYKLRTPGGKVYDYSGPFPPDPKFLKNLDEE